MQDKVITYKIKTHREEKRIFLNTQYGGELEKIIRQLPGRKYSVSHRRWHVPFHENPDLYYRKHLGSYILKEEVKDTIRYSQGYAKGVHSSKDPGREKRQLITRSGSSHEKSGEWQREVNPLLNPKISHQKEAAESIGRLSGNQKTKDIDPDSSEFPAYKARLKEYECVMELKRLSPRTREIYLEFFKAFVRSFKGELQELDYRQLYAYIRQSTKDLGNTRRKQLIAAIKFYYEKYLNREKMYFNLGKIEELPVLPVTLNLEQIRKLLDGISSPHDRLLLFLAYHLNLTPLVISTLKANEELPMEVIPAWAQKPLNMGFLKDLLRAHLSNIPQAEWLFENRGTAYTALSLRKKVYRLLSYYRLKEIYKLQAKEGIEAYDYAPATRQQYLSFFMKFMEENGYKHPYFVSKEEIMLYLLSVKEKSSHLQNSIINSLNFFFAKIYKKPIPEDWILRPRKGRVLPNVFEREEIEALLRTTKFMKHKLMFAILYGGGLRRSELLSLKLDDINLKKGLVFIRGGKGEKDRYTLLSPSLREWIEEYIHEAKPVYYLFEGVKAGERYSATSLANALKTAARRAGIHRRVHLHMFRHSFTTHLIEDGEDISVLQKLLGHTSIKTTERYTHMANQALRKTRSPIENLSLSIKKDKFTGGSSP